MLKSLGHNVEILEKSTTSTPETQGAAGLAVAVDLRRYLQEYDRTQMPYGVVSPDFRLINPKGELVKEYGHRADLLKWGGHLLSPKSKL